MKKSGRAIGIVAIILLMTVVLSMAMPATGEPAFAQDRGTDPAAALKTNGMSAGAQSKALEANPMTAGKKSAALKANPMTIGVKSAKAKVKKGKKVTFKRARVFSVQNAKGKVTFKKIKGNSRITVSRTGKVIVKKGLKKGRTYTVNVNVRAAGTKTYAAKALMVTMKVRVTSHYVKVKTVGPKNTKAEGTGISHVVILGVDGAGTFFRDLDMHYLKTIMENGAVTYDCLTSYPTISAECWGSMFHGVPPEFHGLTNDIVTTYPYPNDSPYPSVFRVIRENMPEAELASFCNWNPINIGIIEDGIDVKKETAGDAELTEMVCGYLEKNDPTLLFVQFDDVDHAGHEHGYGSWDHMLTLLKMDENIGKIYSALGKRGLLDSTLFIVTADHGGTPEGSHGGWTDEEKFVMFAAAGPGIEAGEGKIDDMEVRDVPSIVLYALGLSDKQPSTWTSRIPAHVFQGAGGGERPE